MSERWRAALIFSICSLTFAGFTIGAYSKPAEPRHSGTQQPAKPAPGIWGGEHIRLEVTDAGARVEYDCAHATISRKIVADRQGRFIVMGSYVPEHGGPVREGDPTGEPVQFTGKVSGKKLQLSIRRRDSRKLIGVFTLFFGQEGLLVKCR